MLSVPWQRQSTHSVAYPFVQAQKFWKNAGIIVKGNSKASSSHVLWRHITPRQNCHQQKKSSKHSVNLLRTLTISNVTTYRASARWITQNLKCHRVRKAHSCREVSLSWYICAHAHQKHIHIHTSTHTHTWMWTHLDFCARDWCTNCPYSLDRRSHRNGRTRILRHAIPLKDTPWH